MNRNQSVTAEFELFDEGGETSSEILSQLVGTWKSFVMETGCQSTISPLDPFFTGILEIRNDSTSRVRTVFFSDGSCTTTTGTVQIIETSFVVGNKITTNKGFIVYEVDTALTKLVSIVNGVEQIVFSGLGPTTYNILRLEGDTLYGGIPCACSLPAKRATELDFTRSSIRQ